MRVFCNIGRTYELSLEFMSTLSSHEELTNHWLSVITAYCVRKFGTLTPEKLNIMIEMKKEGRSLTVKEKAIIDSIEMLKRNEDELSYGNIYDNMKIRIKFVEFERLLKKLVEKKVLKSITDRYYDLYI